MILSKLGKRLKSLCKKIFTKDNMFYTGMFFLSIIYIVLFLAIIVGIFWLIANWVSVVFAIFFIPLCLAAGLAL